MPTRNMQTKFGVKFEPVVSEMVFTEKQTDKHVLHNTPH